MTEPGTGTTRSAYAHDIAQVPECWQRPLPLRQRQGDPDHAAPALRRQALQQWNRAGPRALRTRTHGPKQETPNGDYQFDYAFPYYAPYVLSDEVAKHRLVAVGSFDVPWGITVGAKLVIESPKPPGSRHRHLARKNRSAERPELRLLQDLAGTASDDRLSHARSAGDEDHSSSRMDLPSRCASTCSMSRIARTTSQYINTFPGPPSYVKDGDIAGVPRTFKLSLNFNW